MINISNETNNLTLESGDYVPFDEIIASARNVAWRNNADNKQWFGKNKSRIRRLANLIRNAKEVSPELTDDDLRIIVNIRENTRKLLERVSKIVKEIGISESTANDILKQSSNLLSKEEKDFIIDNLDDKTISLEDKALQLSNINGVDLNIAKSIFQCIPESKPISKKPYRKHPPKNYKGSKDTVYGTALECEYLPKLKAFLVAIDEDAHGTANDIPLEDIKDAIPEFAFKTRTHRSVNGGIHRYYLSLNPFTLKDGLKDPDDTSISAVNIDVQSGSNYKELGDGEYERVDKKRGKLIAINYRSSPDGSENQYYEQIDNGFDDVLVIDSINELMSTIYENLHDKNFIDGKIYNLLVNEKGSKNHKKFKLPSNESIDAKISTSEDDQSTSNDDVEINEDYIMNLICKEIAKIISDTADKGLHNIIIPSLEGGLGQHGVNEDGRIKILSKALTLTNQYDEHIAQVEASVENHQPNKTGFPTIVNAYPQSEEGLNKVKNILELFLKKDDDITSYDLIKVPYLKLAEDISEYVFNKDEKSTFNPIMVLDSYFYTMGLSLNTRYLLFRDGIPYLLNKNDSNKPLLAYIERSIEYGAKSEVCGLMGNNNKFYDDIIHLSFELKEDQILSHKIYQDLTLLERTISITPVAQIQALQNIRNYPNFLKSNERRQRARAFLKEDASLTLTKKTQYIFDEDKMEYAPITVEGLGNFIATKYHIYGIERNELENLYKQSDSFSELQKEYYMFDNGVLNMEERHFIPTTNLKAYFTENRIHDTITFHEQVIDVNPYRDDDTVTLTEMALREILIPEYDITNPNGDTSMYYDFLERVGAVFNTRNKHRKFALYYGIGKNGKEILITILKSLLDDKAKEITMETIKDPKADISGIKLALMDEIEESLVEQSVAFIKRITGGKEKGASRRKLYSEELVETNLPSFLFLFCNTDRIPKVPQTDEAYYERSDLLGLINRFLEHLKKNSPPNEFLEDSDLKDKLKEGRDDLGCHWLLNGGLQQYYKRFVIDENGEERFLGFTCGQSSDETLMIINKADPMRTFLIETYTKSNEEDLTITNKTMTQDYKNYCNNNGYNYSNTNLESDIGKAIITIFGEVKSESRRDGAKYKLCYKSEKEIEKDNNTKYRTNEDYPMESTSIDNSLNGTIDIYQRIKEREAKDYLISRKELKDQFANKYAVEDIILNLLNEEYIVKEVKVIEVGE